MLERKTYTPEELDRAKTDIEAQLAAYSDLTGAVDDETPSESIEAARESFEALFFNTMALALDRYFVHRMRGVTGSGGTPLDELELICDSLTTNDGVLLRDTAGYVPERSVLQLEPGESIALTADQFDQLAQAVFAEVEAKLVTPGQGPT